MSDQNCQISSDGFASHVTSGHDLCNLSIDTRPLQILPRQTGWDQQMSYTWASDRWVMPAPYYTTTVVYADLGHPGDVDLKFVFLTQKSHRNQKKCGNKEKFNGRCILFSREVNDINQHSGNQWLSGYLFALHVSFHIPASVSLSFSCWIVEF